MLLKGGDIKRTSRRTVLLKGGDMKRTSRRTVLLKGGDMKGRPVATEGALGAFAPPRLPLSPLNMSNE